MNEEGTPMAEFLAREGIRDLYICGLATDYCVRETALEGLRLSFSVTVLVDAVAGVDLLPGDSQRALAELKTSGALFARVGELLQSNLN